MREIFFTIVIFSCLVIGTDPKKEHPEIKGISRTQCTVNHLVIVKDKMPIICNCLTND